MNNTYGLMFPIILEDGAPAQPGLKDSIESSIRIILAYQINSRNFLSTFGCVLESLLGSPNAATSRQVVQIFTIKAIVRWEQRIQMTGSNITQDAEFMAIELNGTIKDTQTQFKYQILV